MSRALTDFANEDLSAFDFDIRKDSLYCDAPGDPKRRAYRTALDTLFHALVRWARAGAGVHERRSVGHALSRRGQRAFVGVARNRQHLARKWLDAKMGPDCALSHALANERSNRCAGIRLIGSSLQAEVELPEARVDPIWLKSLSSSAVKQGPESKPWKKPPFDKCGRCWRLLARSGPRRRSMRPVRGGGPWLSGAWRSGSPC